MVETQQRTLRSDLWKEANTPMSKFIAQWTRIPNFFKGGATGGAYGAAGAAQSGECACR
jgi:hypothetical protein